MKIFLIEHYSLIKGTREFRFFLYVLGFQFLIASALTLSPAAQARSFQAEYQWQHWIGFMSWLISMITLLLILRKNKINTGPILLPTIALLTGWGILTVYRLAPSLGIKQSIWMIAASAGMAFLLPRGQVVISLLRRYKYLWLTAGLLITGLTLIFGTNPSGIGPKLWLGCCGIYFQPSEPLKLLLILYLAAYFADRKPLTRGLLPLIFPTLIVSGLAWLILIIQRDLGTAAIMIFIYASMVYMATGNRRILIISLLTFIGAAVLGYYLFDVVQLRAEAWINPWLDPSGRSYQIVQSLISIGSGGVSGRGPGMGNPTLVPISFSDFIFSSIAEEYGLPGTIGLLAAISLLVYQSFSIGLQAPTRHMRYMAVGIAAFLGGQSILIIGGNIRALPLTGVTLPFISYGGSSLFTSFLSAFLLIGIANSPERPKSTGDQSAPIFHLAAAITAGIFALALFTSWWAVIRGPDLITRTDNARRTISDRFIQRGKILDRNNVPLSSSIGLSGNFQREYASTETAHVVGYTNPFFGQAGAESSLDPILRGLENQNPWNIWFNHLLYGQPPTGLDARISIDLDLQIEAADLIGETPGAVVLINSQTGELLVLYSSPTYNSNMLEEDWGDLIERQDAPLLNRTTDGLYPPGPILAPFYLMHTQTFGPLPQNITTLDIETENTTYTCVKYLEMPVTWEQAARDGCPGPLQEFGLLLGESGLSDLFTKLGFYETPAIRLDLTPAYTPLGLPTPTVTAYGQADILISPLQLAIAASTITNQGNLPAATLLLEAETSDGTWINYLNPPADKQVFPSSSAVQTAQNLSNHTLPIWESIAYARTESGQKLTWYTGGTLSASSDKNFTVVVLLEDPNPTLAEEIGQGLLTSVLP